MNGAGDDATPIREDRKTPMHDLIIRGARVFDGLGNPGVDADVAVSDGRVAAIGNVK